MAYLVAAAALFFAFVVWANSGPQYPDQDPQFVRECAAHNGKFTPYIDPRYSTCDTSGR
jgi:hypothetical protein